MILIITLLAIGAVLSLVALPGALIQRGRRTAGERAVARRKAFLMGDMILNSPEAHAALNDMWDGSRALPRDDGRPLDVDADYWEGWRRTERVITEAAHACVDRIEDALAAFCAASDLPLPDVTPPKHGWDTALTFLLTGAYEPDGLYASTMEDTGTFPVVTLELAGVSA